jgi:hypothetical protein
MPVVGLSWEPLADGAGVSCTVKGYVEVVVVQVTAFGKASDDQPRNIVIVDPDATAIVQT